MRVRLNAAAGFVLSLPAAIGMLSGASAGEPSATSSGRAESAERATSGTDTRTATPDRARYGDPAEYEARDLPVTEQDLEILLSAAELIADDSGWNRTDDRVCTDDESAGKRSLFCALQAASIQVLGGYHHRRVALQEVRFAIEKSSPDREFEHRSMGFNNLAATTFADVQAVLQMARERVPMRLHAGGIESDL